jgi:hypothetical protein
MPSAAAAGQSCHLASKDNGPLASIGGRWTDMGVYGPVPPASRRYGNLGLRYGPWVWVLRPAQSGSGQLRSAVIAYHLSLVVTKNGYLPAGLLGLLGPVRS